MASYNLGKVVGDDGISLDYKWEGTSLGIKTDDEEEYTYVDLKGDKGDTGNTGASGSDGYSPTVATSKEGKTTTIEIIDKNGTHTATIQDGADGSNGVDGTSPTASVSKSGNTATITITDKNGTTTTSVSDGVNGTNGRDGYVQYTAGSNISISNENVISATDTTYHAGNNVYIDSDNTINVDLSYKQDIIQYSIMPTASFDEAGKIVQYIGTTDSTYTNGYFYKCVENSGSYSWENIQVQTGGSGGDSYKQVYYLTTSFASRLATSLNATDIATCNKVIDEWRSGKDVLVIAKDITFWTSSTSNDICKYAIGVISSSGNNIYFTFYRPYVNGENISVYSTCLSRFILFSNVGTPANVTSASLSKANQPSVGYDIIRTGNTTSYTVSGDYNPAHKLYVDTAVNPTITTSSTSTYTIANLIGNQTYKLGEITSLTITATTTFDRESIIYFTSGTTATSVSLPDSITNLGDAPTMTNASNVNTGTCEASKSYIIAVLNDIAVWKAY